MEFLTITYEFEFSEETRSAQGTRRASLEASISLIHGDWKKLSSLHSSAEALVSLLKRVLSCVSIGHIDHR